VNCQQTRGGSPQLALDKAAHPNQPYPFGKENQAGAYALKLSQIQAVVPLTDLWAVGNDDAVAINDAPNLESARAGSWQLPWLPVF
jgi:hypothetical protein